MVFQSVVLKLIMSLLFFSSTITTVIATLPKQQELDRISALPGQPPVTFSQFSGYVTVNEQHGRALFYWLTEATSFPEKKPLVLWVNGGPGASSVAYGASEEIGPFRINQTGSSLYLNEYSWNKEANLLFLESPAGVGFSYTNSSSNLKYSGDKRTAEDALVFLIKWMSRFPQYKHREFYIAGESYAGHYVPQLAEKIVEYNKALLQPILNLKGFIVGNALIDEYYDFIGKIIYWWSHSMISDTSYRSILKKCNFKEVHKSQECNAAVRYVEAHEHGNINEHSIYTPLCMELLNNTMSSPRLKNTLLHRRVSGYDPCAIHYAKKYYNLPEVQKSMHADVNGILHYWTDFSADVNSNWTDSEISMLPTYKKLIAAGLRIWVFSGDTDAGVPVTGTRLSLSHLNLTVKTEWYPWYADDQVGGWTEVYNELTFASVRGAGHEVPQYQPKRAFILFKSFLAGKELPKS
ncbi:serine carboxypeptidase 24-like isoform X1 [Quercus lobata]|uniref:serine carboxypeptidase 24-like isoform X1 n=1 Tax=Quercus lobata TaxID=97700 RepID=UPI001245B590|nr:serine carboxypeptidase 24-like isoform X1 [Quercus lobata]